MVFDEVFPRHWYRVIDSVRIGDAIIRTRGYLTELISVMTYVTPLQLQSKIQVLKESCH